VPNIINGKEKEGCKVCKESQGLRKIKTMALVVVYSEKRRTIRLLMRFPFVLLGPKQAKI